MSFGPNALILALKGWNLAQEAFTDPAWSCVSSVTDGCQLKCTKREMFKLICVLFELFWTLCGLGSCDCVNSGHGRKSNDKLIHFPDLIFLTAACPPALYKTCLLMVAVLSLFHCHHIQNQVKFSVNWFLPQSAAIRGQQSSLHCFTLCAEVVEGPLVHGDIIFHQFLYLLAKDSSRWTDEVVRRRRTRGRRRFFPLPHFTSGRPRLERQYLQKRGHQSDSA